MSSCLKWGEDRHSECSETEDQGYSDCTENRDEGYGKCCGWWPCSWACDAFVWISNVVCVAWTWISNVVCVGWTIVSTAVCVLWDAVTTIANAVYGTLESILGWLLSAIGFFVELIFAIPVIGAALRKGLNVLTHLLWAAVGLFDIGLGAIGIRPEKKLRICTVILRDDRGNAVSSVDYVKSMLQVAADVYKRDANIRLIPLKPFQYDSGFDGDPETVDDSWVTVDDGTSDADVLDSPGYQAESPLRDWGSVGSQYELTAARCCFYGSWRRVLGYGAPVTCFVIRSFVPPDTTGKAGFSTDYIRVMGRLVPPPADSPRTIGHEILHLVGLGHGCVDDDARNIMATTECNPATTNKVDDVNPRLSDYQAMVLRSSKYATYF